MTETKEPSDSVGNKVIVGVIWMVILKISIRSMALVSLTILARLLTPEDFGVVAMAMFVSAILNSIAWFGFDTALIQNQEATDEHYNTAFTFNVIFYTTVAMLLVALAEPVASYYREPRVVGILYMMALGAFVFGLENIGVVNFRKHMKYEKDFQFMLSKKVIAFVVTIPLAFLWRNYWALVVGVLASRIGGTLMSYFLSSFRPRFSLQKAGELFAFSKWLFLSTLFGTLRTRIAEPILGRMSGPASLGHFNMGYEISNMPTTELVAPINRAVYPGYAKIKNDMEAMRAGYLKVIAIISLLALPAAAGIGVTAPLLVPVWLGDKWIDSIQVMQVLAFSGALTAITTNSGAVFLAVGRPRTLAMVSGGFVAVLIVLIIPMTEKFGPIGAAWAYVITALIMNPVLYAIMFRLIDLKWMAFLGTLWRPVVSSALMLGTVHLLMKWMAMTSLAQTFQLILAVLTGVVTYLVVATVLWLLAGKPQGAEIDLVQRVWPIIRKRLPGQR
ncbi:MAG: lipopolysaccharide biosynthesis protein [Gammaproteobacteria bacterium]